MIWRYRTRKFWKRRLIKETSTNRGKNSQVLAAKSVLLTPPLLFPTVGLIKSVTYLWKPWLATGFRSGTSHTIQRHPPPSVRTWPIVISQQVLETKSHILICASNLCCRLLDIWSSLKAFKDNRAIVIGLLFQVHMVAYVYDSIKTHSLSHSLFEYLNNKNCYKQRYQMVLLQVCPSTTTLRPEIKRR